MKGTDAEVAEVMERVEIALAEVEEAKRAYDAFVADWKRRCGYPDPHPQEAA